MELSQFLPQLILAMALIVILIAALGFVGARLVTQRQRAAGGLVKVLSCTPIGTREKLMLISLGRRRVLVGVTPSSINALLEVADHELPEATPEPNWTDSIRSRMTQSFRREAES